MGLADLPLLVRSRLVLVLLAILYYLHAPSDAVARALWQYGPAVHRAVGPPPVVHRGALCTAATALGRRALGS